MNLRMNQRLRTPLVNIRLVVENTVLRTPLENTRFVVENAALKTPHLQEHTNSCGLVLMGLRTPWPIRFDDTLRHVRYRGAFNARRHL